MSELRSALEGLTTHPGWHAFKAEARRRWGPEGYARELKKAVTEAFAANQSAEAAIKAVDMANNEINALLTWVDMALRAEVHREEAEERGPVLSRRGPNL